LFGRFPAAEDSVRHLVSIMSAPTLLIRRS